MDQSVSRLSYLFKRYTENNCSAEERNEFVELVKQETNILELNALISNAVNVATTDREISRERADELFATILNKTTDDEITPLFSSKKKKTIWWAAAAILLVLGSSIYFMLNKETVLPVAQIESVHKHLADDVAPGYEGAILTLSNGQKITLDNADNGMLAKQGSTNVIKQNGQIVYNEKNISKNEVLYNTMTTPRGRQYSLVLADGTKVWLNAASSITFPTAFAGDERKVQITGEAYFEVAKNAAMPFKVEVGKMEVKVLGTHFNIKAYDDEPAIKTTLLEGSVRVSNDNADAFLKPGQEAILDHKKQNFKVAEANIKEAVAWKNGLFEFNNAGIRSIMLQLSRWYDIEIDYEGNVEGKSFSGVMSRNTNLSQVLNMLQLTKEVHFKMDGTRVIVSPGQ